MRHYPPAHVIHEATCPDAPPGLITFRAHALEAAFPTSRPHTCFDQSTVTLNREVVAEPGGYEPHEYQASTIHPADAYRRLCEVCRGTHGEAEDPAAGILGLSEQWR
jgi:hypothetical protein